jgi:putative ABC transport system permease protein
LNGRLFGLKAERARQFRVRPFPLVARESADYLDAFARGESVLVSDNLAFRLGLRVGDRVSLPSPSGRHDFRIGAVVLDYSLDLGTLTIETDVYRRWWRDEQVSTFLVHLASGQTAAAVSAGITERLAPITPVSVLTAGEFKTSTARAIDHAFALTYAIQLVAACVAAIGVVNFFLAEVLDRRREIGLVRTVAFDRRQLVRSLSAEALLLGVGGGLLAVAWGWPIARIVVTHSCRAVSGWQLAFAFPWTMALAIPAVVAFAARVAVAVPAYRTARLPLTRLVGIE